MLPTSEDITQLYRLAPYLPLDLQGWHSDSPIFEEVIAAIKPRCIIEVGSWKGASAVHMATLAKKYDRFPEMICVDFFHTMQIDGHHGSFDLFLSNIRHCGLTEQIRPLRGQSVECSKALSHLGAFKACSLIYIDADHTEKSVHDDLEAYWPLLAPGGIMLGDDYHEIPTVKVAVQKFCRDHGLTVIDCNDGYHFRINKPL